MPSWSIAPVQHSSLSGGGTFDTRRHKERLLQFQAEYKWRASWYGVQPIASLMATEKGSLYFCFGACYDIYLKSFLVLTPSFKQGIYLKNEGKELGYPLEVRSSIALAAEFCNYNRLGLKFYHNSNAKARLQKPRRRIAHHLLQLRHVGV